MADCGDNEQVAENPKEGQAHLEQDAWDYLDMDDERWLNLSTSGLLVVY